MDPDTLETKDYDPYGDQVDSRAFTAHPKIDPFTSKLVVFGYEAKGPGSDDVLNYSIVETPRAHDRFFPFFPAVDGRNPEQEPVVDFVQYEIDPTQFSGSNVSEPRIILDIHNEFPRIDERYMSEKYNVVLVYVFFPGHNDSSKNIFAVLNAVAMTNTKTGQQKFYWPGENCYCQVPVFVPRHQYAPECNGWIMFVVERGDVNASHLVFLDTTEDVTIPIAVADLPLRLRPQIHGNWVDASELNEKPLVREPTDIKFSDKGWFVQPDGTVQTNGTVDMNESL